MRTLKFDIGDKVIYDVPQYTETVCSECGEVLATEAKPQPLVCRIFMMSISIYGVDYTVKHEGKYYYNISENDLSLPN